MKRIYKRSLSIIIVFLIFCTIFPNFNYVGKCDNSGNVLSRAECVIDASSRRILYKYNGEEKLPMASTTKILTAITVIENVKDLNEEIVIPKEATNIEGSSVYLKENDRLTIMDLLYGLMLRSGNDCAVALAIHTAKTIRDFAIRMNLTAEKAGALNSHFMNPHGLPSENHYTTAKDLALIASYAMDNSIFRKIVSTKYYEKFNWKNKNKMLYEYDGAIGIKTGYTIKAGRCLVTCAKRNNLTLICVVLNSPDMYNRSSVLLNDAFSNYKNICIFKSHKPIIINKNDKKIKGYINKDLYYPLLDDEKTLLKVKVQPCYYLKEKNSKNEIIGQLNIYLINQLLFSEILYKL